MLALQTDCQNNSYSIKKTQAYSSFINAPLKNNETFSLALMNSGETLMNDTIHICLSLRWGGGRGKARNKEQKKAKISSDKMETFSEITFRY